MELKKHQLVLIEGRTYPDGHIIEHGAVQVLTGVVPVVLNFGNNPLGRATNWTRDKTTGECRMDLEWLELLPIEYVSGMDLNVYLTQVVRRRRTVVSGVLNAVSFTLPVKGGWHYDIEEVKDGEKSI